jgi:hypothetical protein
MARDLGDNSPMPWGKHKGKPLKELPADYLLWLYEQPWIKDWPALYGYLKKNEDLLMAEKQQEMIDDDDHRGFDSYQDYRNHRGF